MCIIEQLEFKFAFESLIIAISTPCFGFDRGSPVFLDSELRNGSKIEEQ